MLTTIGRGEILVSVIVHLSTSIKFLDFRNKLAREHLCIYQSILYACVSYQLLKCINIYSTGNCSHGECMPETMECKSLGNLCFFKPFHQTQNK